MGVRLLTRTTRVVRVTEVGLRYAGDCRHAAHEVRAFLDMAIQELRGGGGLGKHGLDFVIEKP